MTSWISKKYSYQGSSNCDQTEQLLHSNMTILVNQLKQSWTYMLPLGTMFFYCLESLLFVMKVSLIIGSVIQNGESPSIRRRNSTWKVRRNYINSERRIHVEIMTSIRRGNCVVDSTFKIDEILMRFPRGFFCVVSTSNPRNFCTRCFHCIIS